MTVPDPARLRPKLVSFDVFGTLIDSRGGSYGAFTDILRAAGDAHVDVKAFWEVWEERNIAQYWQPYRRYRDICETSLADAFAHFELRGDPKLIQLYFDVFPGFRLFPDVAATLDVLSKTCRLAVVSNIDDDLLQATPLGRTFDLVCTAERAHGYKPDRTLFKYLLEHAQHEFGAGVADILHCGQSQFTDLVGGKPVGLTIAWINRREISLDPQVPRPDYVFPDVRSLLSLVAVD